MVRASSALLAPLAASVLSRASAADTSKSKASVISVPVTEYWEGRGGGGTWSTFALQVGTPAQAVRLLPATSGTSIWVVLDDVGCIPDYGSQSTCTQNRGGTYNPNASSTWTEIGVYNLFLYTEAALNYTGNGEYGFETVTLGLQGSGLPTLQKQVIAGIATGQFWLGSLPLSSAPVNFTSMDDPQPGLLESLKNASNIPSLSWAYTAGAYKRSPQIFGSLTLGGYDTTRFVENSLTFGMNDDVSRDLVLPVPKIVTSNGFNYTPSQADYYFIDSLIPDLWLPPAACEVFERAFSLTLDNATGLYLVNSSLHSQLERQNTSVTFTLGPGNNVNSGNASEDTFEVTMPYWAFDLTASYPLLSNNTTSAYFPLRQASDNTSQYTLGRAFLQSAYVIADYERHNFSVHQAQYPGDGTNQELVSILSKSSSSSSSGGGGSSGIGGGAIAGIVIGVIVALALVALAAFLFRRRKRRAAAAAAAAAEAGEKGAVSPSATADPYNLRYEADGTPAAIVEAGGVMKHKYAEAEGPGSAIHEAPQGMVNEMEGYNPKDPPPRQELHSNVHEMDSGLDHVPEMDTPLEAPREKASPVAPTADDHVHDS